MASWGLWGWFVLAGSLSFRQSADQALHQIEAALRQGDAGLWPPILPLKWRSS